MQTFSHPKGGANVSARQMIGAVLMGLLAGVGFATLFVHVLTGECIPWTERRS
jgi:hypothetical protein